MFDNEIVPINMKFKRLRLMLEATQGEIAYNICTKNTISQIENNKQNPTLNLAIGIAKNFNEIAKKKEINIELITGNYLMQDENAQANNIFKNIILNELQEISEVHLFEEKLNEAEDLIERYNITDNIKMQLYKLAADFYYSKFMYSKSDAMCNMGLKIDIKLKNIFDEAYIYICKSKNSLMTMKYAEAIEQIDYAEMLNNRKFNNLLFELIYYYKALIYKKMCEYDKSIKSLIILKEKIVNKDSELYFKTQMVYANCLNDQNKFDEAKRVYIEILEKSMKNNDKGFMALAYRNLSELYLNKKEYKSAILNIQYALSCNPNDPHIGEFNYFAAKVMKYSDEDIESYLLKALEICEKTDREKENLTEKTIYELVVYYINKEDEEKILLMADKVEALNISHDLIYNEIIRFYKGRNEKKFNYFIEKSIKKSKQAKKI